MANGWDLVYGRLLTLCPALSNLTADSVFDGLPLTDAPLETLVMVGMTFDRGAGAYEQTPSPMPGLVDETGEVNVTFIAQSGDTDLAPLRSRLSTFVDELRESFTADETAGVLTPGSEVHVARVEPDQQQTKNGAVVQAVVTVGYTTRL